MGNNLNQNLSSNDFEKYQKQLQQKRQQNGEDVESPSSILASNGVDRRRYPHPHSHPKSPHNDENKENINQTELKQKENEEIKIKMKNSESSSSLSSISISSSSEPPTSSSISSSSQGIGTDLITSSSHNSANTSRSSSFSSLFSVSPKSTSPSTINYTTTKNDKTSSTLLSNNSTILNQNKPENELKVKGLKLDNTLIDKGCSLETSDISIDEEKKRYEEDLNITHISGTGFILSSFFKFYLI
jgi:hypothetical protein